MLRGYFWNQTDTICPADAGSTAACTGTVVSGAAAGSRAATVPAWNQSRTAAFHGKCGGMPAIPDPNLPSLNGRSLLIDADIAAGGGCGKRYIPISGIQPVFGTVVEYPDIS